MYDFLHSFPLNFLQDTHLKSIKQAVHTVCDFCAESYVLLMGSINTDSLSLTSNSRFGTASCFILSLWKEEY